MQTEQSGGVQRCSKNSTMQRGSVFLADDADPALPDPIREACTLAGIPVETAASARQLGQACGISVAATAAGVI